MDADEARQRFAAAPVARLGTAAAGRPRVVPIVFAVVGHRLYFVVDAKPKSTTDLRRLADIRANPRVSVLVDHYVDDWDELWWARADGEARILDGFDPAGLAGLTARYPRYREQPPPGPMVEITVDRWSGWAARG